MSQLIIFDFDWTLARGENTTQEKPFRASGERYVWMEDPERLHSNRRELLEWLHHDGVDNIAIATNQGGISYGFQDYEEIESAIWALLKELSFPVPLLICPYHERYPERYPEYRAWRKPLPGMLLALHRLFPQIPPENVVVVGDREEDRRAAQNAGFEYVDHQEFFDGIESNLEAFISAEQNAGEVFEEDAPPF